jgi:hypothetical protein
MLTQSWHLTPCCVPLNVTGIGIEIFLKIADGHYALDNVQHAVPVKYILLILVDDISAM